jgi:hypothetical protein
MPTCVRSGYGRLRDSSSEITQTLEHVTDGATEFIKLLIVETATYQTCPNCCLFTRWQASCRGQTHLRHNELFVAGILGTYESRDGNEDESCEGNNERSIHQSPPRCKNRSKVDRWCEIAISRASCLGGSGVKWADLRQQRCTYTTDVGYPLTAPTVKHGLES